MNLAIFASGGGSNAEAIINYFSKKEIAAISMIVTNKASAKVLDRAKTHNIATRLIAKEEKNNPSKLIVDLRAAKIDWIILAGYLWPIPQELVSAYPNKILNIHPALLPKFGGKGMYGQYVHQAVFDNFERESGMTIHYVNENYDEGEIIFQAKVPLETLDTPDIIASKVLALEHHHYPRVIEKLLLNQEETTA